MRRALAVAALLLAACVPHFREDADRARRAMDAEEMQDLLDAAHEAAASGDHEGAAEAYLAAIDANPRFPASVYLGLARELVDAGDPVSAVVVTRWVLAQRPGELGAPGASPGPLDGVAARLAAVGLPALALDVLARGNGGAVDPAVVARIPALDEQVGELVRARAHAAGGRPDEAMRSYGRWVAAYGVADHPVLRGWAAEALGAQDAARAVVRGAAQGAAGAGDFVRAARAYGLALVYQPQAGPSEAAPLVEACRRAGDLLRLGPDAALRVDEATRAAEQERLGPALRAYRQAVVDAPWHPELRRNLATLLAAVGLYGEAARQGEWLLAFRPDDVAMREQVAAWRTQGQTP